MNLVDVEYIDIGETMLGSFASQFKVKIYLVVIAFN